jgi:hypothetical protein
MPYYELAIEVIDFVLSLKITISLYLPRFGVELFSVDFVPKENVTEFEFALNLPP